MVRYLVAAGFAALLVGAAFWFGAVLAGSMGQGTDVDEPYLRGEPVWLCGYKVDSRYSLAGYEFDEWHGERCENLSSFDECLLGCLSDAGTVEGARDCYPVCADEDERRRRSREESLW